MRSFRLVSVLSLLLFLAAACRRAAPPTEEAAVPAGATAENPAGPDETPPDAASPENGPGDPNAPADPALFAARHLLFMYKGGKGAPPDVTRTKEEARKEAEKALARIRKGEATVAALAPQVSDCPSRAHGGDLGTFTLDMMVKPFSDAVAALKPGEISGIVETEYGFHVVERYEPAQASSNEPSPEDAPPPPSEEEEGGEEISVRHLLVMYKGVRNAPPEVVRTKEDAKKKAEELLEKIRNQKGTIESLAADHSDCPSKAQGGNLPPLRHGGMVKAFTDAAFALKPGETSGVVETEYGFHIIQRYEPEWAATAALFVFYKGENAPPEIKRTKEEARARVEEALKKIRGGGDFAEILPAYSDHPNAKSGGYMPRVRRGDAPPDVDKAIFTLKPGEVSDVVEMPGAYLLVRRVEDVVYRASHILIQWKGLEHAPPNVTRTKEEAKQKADELLVQVKNGSVKFADLARRESECPSRAKGGDLGEFGQGMMAPPFEKAVAGLKLDEVSGIVETDFGYHIIQRTK